jgi:hypothetical protein
MPRTAGRVMSQQVRQSVTREPVSVSVFGCEHKKKSKSGNP